MAKIGLLYLHHGLWENKAIVSSDWVKESLRGYYDCGYGYRYGYMWYIKEVAGKTGQLTYTAYSAAGTGGQRIYLIPDLDVAIAATSRTSFTSDKSYILNTIIEEYCLNLSTKSRYN